MLWVALHLPALSLEAWSATLGPAHAGRPLALLHDHQVQRVDAVARARGVRPGMKRATALALASDLLLGQADARRDAQALRAVAHAALAFSPAVAWATPEGWRPSASEAGAQGEGDRAGQAGEGGDAPPNPAPSPALVGVRLEVQSCLRYFGGLPALLAQLRASLAPLGHRLRIATAPTALGAALLAAWRPDLADGPHSHRLAALQPLLDAVPLHLLGPGQQHWQALQGMGLSTLADLAGLPRTGLARRFSPELLDDIDRARGHAPEAQRWLTLPQRFASRIELFSRADTSEQLLAGAGVLLPRLVAWAMARQVRILRFTLVMHHEPRHRHDSDAPERSAITIAPALPTVDFAHLQALLAEHLGRMPLPAPALELSLLCDATTAGAAPNDELFASQASRREGLARLVERLQARLGRGQVQSLSPVADHRAECGARWLPADAARLAALPMAGAAPAAPPTLATQPLWLLPMSQALPERNQRPLLEGRPLQLLAGPERLETGWWDDAGLAVRDYFIAQSASGALVWLYRNRLPANGQGEGWFLQGWFG